MPRPCLSRFWGSSGKVIVVDNPTGLPMLPLDEIHLFHGDLKLPPSPTDMDKLKRSILEHHLFVAKAVFFENGAAYAEDGHQTLKALHELQADGYTKSSVITYGMEEGRYVEKERVPYDEIMIPYQVIVPRGETPEERRRDAAEKLRQINSQYAKINPAQKNPEGILDREGTSGLRGARDARRLSRGEVLELVSLPGLSQARLSFLEGGIVPTQREAEALAVFFGVAVDELFPQMHKFPDSTRTT